MYSSKIFLPKGIKCSFIINRQLSINDENAKEEEMSEKILYFIPCDMPLVQQVKYANIAEAMIEFFSSFEEDSDIKCVESDKYSYFFSKWEKDTWFVMVLYKGVLMTKSGEKQIKSFSSDTVVKVMKDIYQDFALFYQPIESLLYKKNDEGVVICKEIINLRLKLRKAKYVAECIKSGEMNETEENKKCVDQILQYQEAIKKLEEQSELPSIRQCIHKVMRKSLICYNWEQLHSTYAIDGMLPLPIDKSSSIDLHNLMNQVYVSFPEICYSCFLFDDYFIWSDLRNENQKLMRFFHNRNQDLMQNAGDTAHFLSDTDGQLATPVYLTVLEKESRQLVRHAFQLLRYRQGRITLILLINNDAGEHTEDSLKPLRKGLIDQFSSRCLTINNNLAASRGPVQRSNDNSFVLFFYEGMTNTLMTNVNANWRDSRGVLKLTPISIGAMNEAMPSSLTFPMSQLYSKLKDEKLFIETVERTNETDWIYGCKQHENILIVLITSNSKASLGLIVSSNSLLLQVVDNVHKMINAEFTDAFTII